MSKIETLIESGNFEEAYHVSVEMLEQDPYNIEVLVQQAVIQRKRKQFVDALNILDRVLNLLPKNADIYSEKGVTLFHLGRLNEALEAMNTSQELEPNNPYRYSSRAYIKDALKDIDGAIADYEKAIVLDPADMIARNNLGMLEEKKGNLSKAKKHFHKVDESAGINYDEVLETIKENDRKKTATQDQLKTESPAQNSIWKILASVFTTKKGFVDFFAFLKNGLK